MPEITSLFNLSADVGTQQAVSASGNAGASSTGFATQLASAMGQSGDSSSASSKQTSGKNIPLRMVASTENVAATDANASADAASENISPLLLSSPVVFSDPIQLSVAEGVEQAPNTQAQAPVAAPQVPQPAPAAADPMTVTNSAMLSSPMVSQTAEEYISGLAMTKPEIGNTPIVLSSDTDTNPISNTNTVASPAPIPDPAPRVEQNNSPFVQVAHQAEPARLQFSEPIILDTPEAGGMRAITPAAEPLYLSSLTPVNRASVAQTDEQASPAADLGEEGAESLTEAATVTGEPSAIDRIWEGLKTTASDIKQTLIGTPPAGPALRATPLLVDNTFNAPLQMTAKVGKPMAENAMQGYTMNAPAPVVNPQATASAQLADAELAQLEATVEPLTDQQTTPEAKPAESAPELAQDSIETNPQPHVEIKKIKPELFEQRTMDYMKRSIAADALVQNQDTASGKDGQASQNQQGKADSQTSIKPAEVQPAEPAANGAPQSQQPELASPRLAPASERVAMNTQKEAEPAKASEPIEHGERQLLERAFQPDPAEPKQAKSEERVLRWESAKDAVNLAKLVQQAGQNGVTKLTVRLTPENLGRLEIQLTEIGGRIDAKIVANSTESRALLASNGEAIRQQLADKGIQINNMDFSFHDSLTRQDQNDHGRGAGQEAKQGRFNVAKGEGSIDFEQAMAQEQAEDANVLYA